MIIHYIHVLYFNLVALFNTPLVYIYAMKIAWVLILICILSGAKGEDSSKYQPTRSKILKSLLSNSLGLIEVSPGAKQQWKNENTQLIDFQIDGIARLSEKLLFIENGSGRLLLLNEGDSLERWDKTKFSGDRFGSFEFVHNDTLFSIGGYGFWRVTGAIRYFNQVTRDWIVLPTNKNVAVASGVNAIFHYAPKASKVYVICNEYPDEYLHKSKKKSINVLHVQIFDLASKKWAENSYALSPNIGKELDDIKVMAATNSSLYVNSKFHDNTLELNFENNSYAEMEEAFLRALVQIEGQRPLNITEKTDSSIFITDLTTEEQYEFVTTRFEKKKKGNIYTIESQVENTNWNNYIVGASFVLNILLAGLWIQSRLTNKTSNNEVTQGALAIEETTKTKKFIDLLDATESSVISTLVENYRAGKKSSIDEINKILGIDKRPYKIANNIRADALKMINKKFMDFSANSDELIIRERSSFDKRFFEYTLNQRYVNKV